MLSFRDFIMESGHHTPKSFQSLLDVVCGECLNESDHITFCDTFGEFLGKFHPLYWESARYFGLDSRFFISQTYSSIEDVKQFVRDVLSICSEIRKHSSFLVELSTGEVMSPYHKNILDHYNDIAVLLNDHSRKLFAMLKDSDKLGKCETLPIVSEEFKKLFDGEDVIPLIEYNGRVENNSLHFP